MRWYTIFLLPLFLIGLSGCDTDCNEDSEDYPECLEDDDDEEGAFRHVDGAVELQLV